MATYESTQIRVKPFLVGAPRDGFVIIRLAEEPSYLSLSVPEWKILERLRDLELTLDAYVKWHLAGREGLTFHEALQLLLRLQRAGFFEETFSEGVIERLEELESQGRKPAFVAAERAAAGILRLLNRSIRERSDLTLTPRVSAFVKIVVSTEGALGFAAILLVLGLRSHFGWSRVLHVLDGPLRQPAFCLLLLSMSFSFAGMVLGFLDAVLLKGDSKALTPWSVVFSSLFFFRIETRDEHTLLLDRATASSYYAFALGLPWFGAFAFWWAASLNQIGFLYLVSFAFAAFGVARFCPLYRSTLIRWAESFTGCQEFLSGAREYLQTRLFFNLWKKKAGGGGRVVNTVLHSIPKSVEHGTHAVAALSIVWLYVCGAAFSSLFARSFPVLFREITLGPLTLNSWASSLLLAINLSVVVLMLSAFGWILVGNVVAVAQVPLRRARRGLASFRSKKSSFEEALMQFLRDNPIFADLPESILQQLATQFQQRSYVRGEKIVQQGEHGEEFYVLADGEAQVVLEKNNGTQIILALLHPGDSFGEGALVEAGVRAATVRAASSCLVLSLGMREFDTLFPEGSSLRQQLTTVVRAVKRIQESQALSHLSARQIREFIAISKLTHFSPGQRIVAEGENAEHAFVLMKGSAAVSHPGDPTVIARLGPGDLIGMTGIIKAARRNADVLAETDVEALKVERNDFLRLCMTNIFVAMLIANLSENQSSHNNQLKKKPA